MSLLVCVCIHGWVVGWSGGPEVHQGTPLGLCSSRFSHWHPCLPRPIDLCFLVLYFCQDSILPQLFAHCIFLRFCQFIAMNYYKCQMLDKKQKKHSATHLKEQTQKNNNNRKSAICKEKESVAYSNSSSSSSSSSR